MRRGYLIGLIVFISRVSFAQSELTLPFMQNVYQSTYSNPVAMPEHKLSIGLPALSSIYTGLSNTGFSYNDAVGRRANDTTYLNFDKMIGNTRKSNYVYAGASVDLFSLRIRKRDFTFSINVTEKASARFSYPKDLLSLAWNGNAEFIGSKADFKSFGVDAIHYREYGFQMAKETRNWVVGGRLKYLTGLSNVNMKTKNFGLSVGEDMYELAFTSNATLNTSGIPMDTAGNIKDVDEDYAYNYFTNTKNKGFALDGGVTYKYSSKLSFTFCFNNIGYIKWKDQVKNYRINAGAEFSGFDLGKAYFKDSTISYEETGDSLLNSMEYRETADAYTTWLVPNFYLTTRYALGKNTEAAASIYFEKYKAIRPAFTVALSQKLGRVVNVIATYSIQYRKFNNLGFGLMIKPGPFQLYAVSDNILAPVFPESVKSLNIRCGMNLVFGRVRNADKQPYSLSKRR